MGKRIYLLTLMFLLALPVCAVDAIGAEVEIATGPGVIVSYSWKGAINDTIPVSVWLETYDNIIVGEIVYTNTKEKKPIQLFGTTHKGKSNIVEMLPDGLITGSISGVITNTSFEGTWTSPDKVVEKGTRFERASGKQYPIRLSAAIVPQARPVFWGYDPATFEGEYRYSYGKNNAIGTVSIRKADAGDVEYRIDTNIGAPSFNIAEIPLDNRTTEKGHPQDNRIVYEYGPRCAVEILLFEGFLFTRYVEGKICQGEFGMNASVAGVFMQQKK